MFFSFLGIIKLKDLEVLKRSKTGRFIKMILDFLRETLPLRFVFQSTNMHDMVHLVNPNDVDNKLIVLDDYILGFQPAIYLEQFISPELTDFIFFLQLIFVLYFIIYDVFVCKKKLSCF